MARWPVSKIAVAVIFVLMAAAEVGSYITVHRQVVDLRSENAALSKDVTDLQAQVGAGNPLQIVVAGLRASIARATADSENLQQRVTAAETVIAAISDRLGSVEQSLQDLSGSTTSLSDLDFRLTNLAQCVDDIVFAINQGGYVFSC